MTFPEQRLVLNGSAATLAALRGTITLGFDGETSAPFAPNASATEVRLAIQACPSKVGDIEVFTREVRDGDGGVTSRQWIVRFYPSGAPAHIGPQPRLVVDASALTVDGGGGGRRELSTEVGDIGSVVVEVDELSEGETPFDPADASDDAIETAIELNATETDDTPDAEAVTYAPPVHVCGDGVRTTAEACDDNNTLAGDGCSALCEVEVGFACVSSLQFGSGVGGLDACSPVCGDGRRIGWSSHAEGCDDNNTVSGDGCALSAPSSPQPSAWAAHSHRRAAVRPCAATGGARGASRVTTATASPSTAATASARRSRTAGRARVAIRRTRMRVCDATRAVRLAVGRRPTRV